MKFIFTFNCMNGVLGKEEGGLWGEGKNFKFQKCK